MLEIPFITKLVPVLLAGLLMLTPMTAINVDKPEYVEPPGGEFSGNYYEINYKINDGMITNNERDLYIYITPKGEFHGWIEIEFKDDKMTNKSWMNNDVATPLGDNSYQDPPLKKEQKIVNHWREECNNNPTKVRDNLRQMVVPHKPSMTWKELIKDILTRESREMTLNEIYTIVGETEKAKNNPNWKAKVRQILQDDKVFERRGIGKFIIRKEGAAVANSETRYVIINGKTGKQVGGEYKDKNRARNRADKLDNEYGAYIHSIKEVK